LMNTEVKIKLYKILCGHNLWNVQYIQTTNTIN
jgi:hypothetical protein